MMTSARQQQQQVTAASAPRSRRRRNNIHPATTTTTTTTTIIGGILTMSIIATALLISGSNGGGLLFVNAEDYTATAATNGLLFQNEIDTQSSSSSSSPLFGGLRRQQFSKQPQQQQQQQQQKQRQHPIHQIYKSYNHESNSIRRIMEQLENSMSYYQTGLREINHIVNYGGLHPFDKKLRSEMKGERERVEQQEGGDEQEMEGGNGVEGVETGGHDKVNRGEEEEEEVERGLLNNNNHVGGGVVVDDKVFKEEERGEHDKEGRRLQEDDETTVDTTTTTTTTTTGEGESSSTKEEDPDDPFKPIRIQFDTTALDTQLTSYNELKIAFVKNTILPRMRDFWSSALSVVPVEDNLFVSTSELQGRIYCGDTEFSKVPNEHISDGVPNADLILYVSGTPSTRFCGPSTLAVAVACNFDQFDRPTAGAINFCLDQIEVDEYGSASESIIDDNVDVAIHEAAHVLGMSSNSYRFFWDPDTGSVRTPRPFQERDVVCVDGREQTLILPDPNTMKFFIANNGQRYASIVTPKVATVARNQFDCQELNGAQLENQPTGEGSCTGDHWDERLFYPEALSGVISPTTNVLSPLTLALLEDSGWYKANYTKAHNSPWGLGVGCDFISGLCLAGGGDGSDGIVPSYSRGFFCNKASSRGCSPAHSHKMACTMIDYSLRGGDYMPPEMFQYFDDKAIGGPREADFCPVYGSVYSGKEAADLDCRIKGNEDSIDVIYSEEYGDNSMCFETTSGEGRCYRAQCIYADFNLKINVDGTWYTCNEDFQQIEVSTLNGAFGTTVTCPRLSQACPDMFCPVNCAGRGECIFDNVGVNGTVRPRCKCFDENDKSASCSETFTLDGKYLRDSGSLTDSIKTNFFEPLIAVFVDHPDTWTTSSWAWAAALFVVFLLMILCICSSFWPAKPQKQKSRRRAPPKNRRS